MQDWSYVTGDTMELTLEVSQNKWPPQDMLPQLWEDNLPAMLEFPLAAALGGLRLGTSADAMIAAAADAGVALLMVAQYPGQLCFHGHSLLQVMSAYFSGALYVIH
jgi:hypothetical protein